MGASVAGIFPTVASVSPQLTYPGYLGIQVNAIIDESETKQLSYNSLND